MEQSLLEFYLEKTGKTPDEVTVLEYKALDVALDYFIESQANLIQEVVDNLNPNL